METSLFRRAGAVFALAAIPCAWAVNGAQPGGHGAANASMGGAAIALPLDAEAAANNPAGLALVPTSVTTGLQAFHGNSSSQYAFAGNELSNRSTTVGPEGGVNWHATSDWTLGLSVDVGGAGSDYRHPALPVPGAANAKASLAVVELLPTAAWRPREDMAFGMSLNLAHERFEARGVIIPAAVPGGLVPLPDHGARQADGIGVRGGALWQPAPGVSVGATFKSRTRMSRLDGYDQDLLAYSGGHLDIPSEYGLGVAWQATPRLTLAADWLRIDWGSLAVMKDPAGFRWRSQPVVRLGAAWACNEDLTLRAGYSRNRSPITSDRAAQNLLVPSINDQAFTLGTTWQATRASGLSVGYEFDPRTTVHGTGQSTGTSLTSKVQMLFASWQYRL
jgi:long-chain fatty acid transport protein